MSLCKGVRGGRRRAIVYQHRLERFERAFDEYTTGRSSWAHLKERGDKLVQIRKR